MSKRGVWYFACAAWIASMSATAHGSVVDVILEEFQWNTASQGQIICRTAPIVGRREAIRTTLGPASGGSGFGWGGYNAHPVAADANRSIVASTGGLTFELAGAADSANMPGSYAYTIFSTAGSNSADREIDLSGVAATVAIKASSGASDQLLRWLIRDDSGAWWLSQEATWTSDFVGKIHWSFPLKSYTWLALTGGAPTDMNDLDIQGETAISVGAVGTPQLSRVTGGGVYVQQSNTSAALVLDWIRWSKHEELVQIAPGTVTHTLSLPNGVALGLSHYGGGYVTSLKIGASPNLCASGFGRGWQWALRDYLHGTVYNPTQAGYDDLFGGPAPIVVTPGTCGSGDRIDVGPFPVVLFNGDSNFDFSEKVDLTRGWPYQTNNPPSVIDTDGVTETAAVQADEVVSEWEATGFYEDVSCALSDPDVSAVRMVWHIGYKAPPSAIEQFGESATKVTSAPVVNWKEYRPDVSPHLDGEQTTTLDDLSNVLFGWGSRIDRNHTAYQYNDFWYWDADAPTPVWVKANLVHPPTTSTPWPPTVIEVPDEHRELSMLATGTSSTAHAIAIYVPDWSDLNSRSVAGIDAATGEVVYAENRVWDYLVRGHYGGNGGTEVFNGETNTRNYNNHIWDTRISGVLAPRNGIYEELRLEAYFLFGTPDDIRASLSELQAAYEGLQPGKATQPQPDDDATNVLTNGELRWTPGYAADVHHVYFGTSEASVAAATTTSAEYKGIATTSYLPVGLTPGSTYYWRVDTANADGSRTGDVWAFTVQPASYSHLQGAPDELFVASCGTGCPTNTIRVQWRDNCSSESGFVIERRKGDGPFEALGATAANTTTFDDTSFSSAQVYEYRVAAVTATGVSAYSPVLQLVAPGRTFDYTFDDLEGWHAFGTTTPVLANGTWSMTSSNGDPILQVGNVAIDGRANRKIKVEMTLTPSVPPHEINLFWQNEDDGPTSFGGPVASPSISGSVHTWDLSSDPEWFDCHTMPLLRLDPTWTNGVTISVTRVWGVDDVTTYPSTPGTPTVSLSGRDVQLSWSTPPSSATGIVVERAAGSGDWEQAAYVTWACNAFPVTSFLDHDTTPGTSYAYRLRAYNARGTSSSSSSASISMPSAIDFRFDVDADFDGWGTPNQISGLTVANGEISGTSTGTDPYFSVSGLSIDADDNPVLYLRMRLSSGAQQPRIFWWDSTSAFSSKVFALPDDGQLHDVVIDLSADAAWFGKTITTLRIDPGFQNGVTFGVDALLGYPPEQRTPQYFFATNGDAEGWTLTNHFTSVSVAGGTWQGTTTANDPYVLVGNLGMPGANCPKLYLGMSMTGGATTARLYWKDVETASWHWKQFNVAGSGAIEHHVLEMANVPFWGNATIDELRIDPGFASGVQVAIDYVSSHKP